MISAHSADAQNKLKVIELQVHGVTTAANFDIFSRDSNGDQLASIEEVRLSGPGAQVSGIQSLAMSLEILPRLRVLHVKLTQVDGVADTFIKEFFMGVVVTMGSLEIQSFGFECET